MLTSYVHQAPPDLLEKMNNLCCVLWQEKQEFEQAATAISNKDLRSTMLTLAQESNQYVSELCSQMRTMGGVPDIEKNSEPEAENGSRDLNDENEILVLCKKNEKKMIGAYRDILNESSLYEGLRKMIRYQLNEMLCAFMQVKQLQTLKFR